MVQDVATTANKTVSAELAIQSQSFVDLIELFSLGKGQSSILIRIRKTFALLSIKVKLTSDLFYKLFVLKTT